MVLLLRKLYLHFTKDPKGVHYFPGRCVKLFPGGGGGPNASFFRNPYTYLLFSKGDVRTSEPPIPLWIRTWTISSYRDNIYHNPASNHNCQALICQD